jgi:phosphoribosylformylglycinamidine (FGAM) synthase-like enzyme
MVWKVFHFLLTGCGLVRMKEKSARLYEAVKACSEFAIDLGINIPTGKDSLSMKQKYPDGEVIAPGTVIISAGGHCDDITAVVEPVLQKTGDQFITSIFRRYL